MKTCCTCKRERDVACFGKLKSSPDGRQLRCKDCDHANKARWRAKHKQPARNRKKDVRLCHLCRDTKPLAAYSGNSPRCRPCNAEHSRNMRAKSKKPSQATLAWKRQNKHRVRASEHKREARKRGDPDAFTSEQWKALCTKYGNVCLACGSTGPLSVDHVVPLSQGGSNGIDNIQPLYMPCNSRKYIQTIDYRHPQAKV